MLPVSVNSPQAPPCCWAQEVGDWQPGTRRLQDTGQCLSPTQAPCPPQLVPRRRPRVLENPWQTPATSSSLPLLPPSSPPPSGASLPYLNCEPSGGCPLCLEENPAPFTGSGQLLPPIPQLASGPLHLPFPQTLTLAPLFHLHHSLRESLLWDTLPHQAEALNTPHPTVFHSNYPTLFSS